VLAATFVWPEDEIGIKQFFYTISVTILITYAIKWATYRMDTGIRPSGGTKSFPSEHASCSFQGAFFLSKLYRWKRGIPVLAFASLATYSRIYDQYHYWRDIIVGFFIALLVNKLFVTARTI
jgi:membrane-associated phospholipid phosphatase